MRRCTRNSIVVLGCWQAERRRREIIRVKLSFLDGPVFPISRKRGRYKYASAGLEDVAQKLNALLQLQMLQDIASVDQVDGSFHRTMNNLGERTFGPVPVPEYLIRVVS
jgi:hypothetical protein